MEALLESIGQQPDLTYPDFSGGRLDRVLALFIPGTGVIEAAAGLGVLVGFGGLWLAGGSLPGLLLNRGLLRDLRADDTCGRVTASEEGWPLSAWGIALLATAGQLAGGLLLVGTLPALSVWLVIGLALVSLVAVPLDAAPVLNALRGRAPSSGAESLSPAWRRRCAARRKAPAGRAWSTCTASLWQAVCDEPLPARRPRCAHLPPGDAAEGGKKQPLAIGC
jgi:hypothetical protein